jgi:nitroreductase
MDALDAISSRCSVREFGDKPIPKDIIEKIVGCGAAAPTARNESPWEFIAVTDTRALKRIADITEYGKFIARSACTVVVCSKDTKYYLEDCCAATENILVAAASLGIGSCWVAGDKKPYCQEILDIVKAPSGHKLVSLIALGYPLKKQKPTAKRPLKEVLHWGTF